MGKSRAHLPPLALVVAGLLLIALLLVFVFGGDIAAAFAALWTQGTARRALNLIAFAAMVGVIFAIITVARHEVDSESGFLAGLVATVAVVPVNAHLHAWSNAPESEPEKHPTPERAGACENVESIIHDLERELEPVSAGTQFARGVSKSRTRGLRWVLGTGYISLWHRVHDGEEELFFIAPREVLITEAELDRLRLEGRMLRQIQMLFASRGGGSGFQPVVGQESGLRPIVGRSKSG